MEGAVARLGPGLPPSQLAALLQHLGRLSFASSSSSMADTLMPSLAACAGQLSGADLAGSLWAAAKVGVLSAGSSSGDQPKSTHPASACCMVGAAKPTQRSAQVGIAVPPRGGRVLLQAVAAQAPGMGWRQLSNVLWAAPILGLAPDEVSTGPVACSAAALQAAARRVLGMGRKCTYCNPAPVQAQLERLLLALEQLPGEPRPQEAAALLMGLAQLQAKQPEDRRAAAGGGQPGERQLQALLLRLLMGLAGAEQQLEHQTIATAAAALDMLRSQLQPPPAFWAAYLRATARVLPACTAASLAAIIKPLAAWQLEPAEAWLAAYCDAVQGRLGDFKPRQLAGVIAGLYALRHAVPLPWLDQLCQAEDGLSHGLVGRVIDSMDAFLAWRLQEGRDSAHEELAMAAAAAAAAAAADCGPAADGSDAAAAADVDYDAFISSAHAQLKAQMNP
jgi:hypothetical protein